MILLSIIIPAFNVEKYIKGCLCSCYAIQEAHGLTDEEIEIIVVDDGSTDATHSILDDEATKHKSLHVLYQENQGQSVARNLAIEKAQGRYIYMVDSDDAINDASAFPMEDIKEGRFDIIGLQVLYKKENGTIKPWSHQMERWPFDQEYASGADFVKSHNIEGLVYGYLFKRQLFVEHPELRFTPGIYHQDEELIFKIFTLAGKTIYRKGYTYLYYEHSGSSINTKTAARKKKLIDDDIIILRNLIDWRESHGFETVMHYKLSYLVMDVLRVLITKGYDAGFAVDTAEKIKALGLYPLPWIASWKYLGMKMLTHSATSLRLLIWLNDKVHRIAGR